MRKPTVKNKYNLDIPTIKKLQVADRSKVCEPRFWRNNVIDAWCILGHAEKPFGHETEFWIGIYDEDAKAYAGKFRFSFSTYGGMCGYEFKKFFQLEDIENIGDLSIQERFLEKINELIDEGILVIPEKLMQKLKTQN